NVPSLLRAIVLIVCLASAAEARAQLKIGTVDMDRVLKEYHKTKEAEAKLNEATNAAKKEYDERAEAYKKALDEINKLNGQLDTPALSADAKASKARERDEKIASLKNMEREINDFRQTREQQLQQQMLRLREGIVKEMTDVVIAQGKSKNLDLVFDKSGASLNRFSPILFSPDSMDFTTEVIVELNKKARATASDKQSPNPAKSVSPPASGSPTKP
ncbi:MAG: OmpH family outer membrane protein, partial [Verrucomicrobiota bacterium]|nr:OmpH family outer membrane protein [Verrucomicrobiota bacterium]